MLRYLDLVAVFFCDLTVKIANIFKFFLHLVFSIKIFRYSCFKNFLGISFMFKRMSVFIVTFLLFLTAYLHL